MIGHLLRVAHSIVREHHKRSARSPHWRAFEKANIATTCAGCSGTTRLQLHHVAPFHLFPERELDVTNVLTLCMGSRECHLQLGHGGNFKLSNPRVREHAEIARTCPVHFDDVVASAHLCAV